MNKTYKEFRADLKAEQKLLPKEQIMEQMTAKSEFSIDLDSLPRQQHHWVQRGIKMSCEGALHPHHSHFLVKR